MHEGVATPGRCHCKVACMGPSCCLLQANGKRGLALRAAKSQVVSSVVLQCFLSPNDCKFVGWVGQVRAKRNPKEIGDLYNSFSRMCDSMAVKVPNTRPYVGGIYKAFQA